MNDKDFEVLMASVKEGGAILRKEEEPTRIFVFHHPIQSDP
ncbi:MAG: hypothetical protein RBR15_13705 [Sphaerochaeta sp.]|nr:hypothetical protein [Sphaerochaeta sp.]